MKRRPDKEDRQDQLSLLEQVDLACDEFEQAWLAGKKPRIEDYLEKMEGEQRAVLLKGLLEIEFEVRAKSDRPPEPQEYRQRFPEDAALIDTVARRMSTTGSTVARAVDERQIATARLEHPPQARPPQARPPSRTRGARPPVLQRFEILGVLGSGGFGTVYRARDRELGREVALKIPTPGVLARSRHLKRFLREARVAARLNHPNICRIFDLGEADGRPYIVMALIKGKSLDQLLDQGKPIPPRRSVYAVYKLTHALEEAHHQGVIHRDLKPSNLMVDPQRGQLIILDFGLARHTGPAASQLTVSGEILGTPRYMSPEQVQGNSHQVGPRSDVYSLGVILYEMLGGRPPFEGLFTEVLGKILYEEPRPPSAFRPALDPRLDAICLKAMSKSAEDRYDSMAAFGAALLQFLKGDYRSPELHNELQGLEAEFDGVPDSAPQLPSLMPGERPASAEAFVEPALQLDEDDGGKLDEKELGTMAEALGRGERARPQPVETARSLWQNLEESNQEPGAVCPSCKSAMPADTLLCNVCGFHQGLHQKFDVLAQDYEPARPQPPTWLQQQLRDNESLHSAMAMGGAFTLLVLLIGFVVLYSMIGAWSWLVFAIGLGAAGLAVTRLLGFRIGPASVSLYLRRALSWRSLWRPRKKYKAMDMRNSATTGEDLAGIRPDWELEVLDLEDTQVSDAAVAYLAELRSLKFLVLRGTAVSQEGFQELREALPKTRIWC